MFSRMDGSMFYGAEYDLEELKKNPFVSERVKKDLKTKTPEELARMADIMQALTDQEAHAEEKSDAYPSVGRHDAPDVSLPPGGKYGYHPAYKRHGSQTARKFDAPPKEMTWRMTYGSLEPGPEQTYKIPDKDRRKDMADTLALDPKQYTTEELEGMLADIRARQEEAAPFQDENRLRPNRPLPDTGKRDPLKRRQGHFPSIHRSAVWPPAARHLLRPRAELAHKISKKRISAPDEWGDREALDMDYEMGNFDRKNDRSASSDARALNRHKDQDMWAVPPDVQSRSAMPRPARHPARPFGGIRGEDDSMLTSKGDRAPPPRWGGYGYKKKWPPWGPHIDDPWAARVEGGESAIEVLMRAVEDYQSSLDDHAPAPAAPGVPQVDSSMRIEPEQPAEASAVGKIRPSDLNDTMSEQQGHFMFLPNGNTIFTNNVAGTAYKIGGQDFLEHFYDWRDEAAWDSHDPEELNELSAEEDIMYDGAISNKAAHEWMKANGVAYMYKKGNHVPRNKYEHKPQKANVYHNGVRLTDKQAQAIAMAMHASGLRHHDVPLQGNIERMPTDDDKRWNQSQAQHRQWDPTHTDIHVLSHYGEMPLESRQKLVNHLRALSGEQSGGPVTVDRPSLENHMLNSSWYASEKEEWDDADSLDPYKQLERKRLNHNVDQIMPSGQTASAVGRYYPSQIYQASELPGPVRASIGWKGEPHQHVQFLDDQYSVSTYTDQGRDTRVEPMTEDLRLLLHLTDPPLDKEHPALADIREQSDAAYAENEGKGLRDRYGPLQQHTLYHNTALTPEFRKAVNDSRIDKAHTNFAIMGDKLVMYYREGGSVKLATTPLTPQLQDMLLGRTARQEGGEADEDLDPMEQSRLRANLKAALDAPGAQPLGNYWPRQAYSYDQLPESLRRRLPKSWRSNRTGSMVKINTGDHSITGAPKDALDLVDTVPISPGMSSSIVRDAPEPDALTDMGRDFMTRFNRLPSDKGRLGPLKLDRLYHPTQMDSKLYHMKGHDPHLYRAGSFWSAHKPGNEPFFSTLAPVKYEGDEPMQTSWPMSKAMQNRIHAKPKRGPEVQSMFPGMFPATEAPIYSTRDNYRPPYDEDNDQFDAPDDNTAIKRVRHLADILHDDGTPTKIAVHRGPVGRRGKKIGWVNAEWDDVRDRLNVTSTPVTGDMTDEEAFHATKNMCPDHYDLDGNPLDCDG